jgi:hypothetical protein
VCADDQPLRTPLSRWAGVLSSRVPRRRMATEALAYCLARFRCIGIDDGLPARKAVAVMGEQARAERFAEFFHVVYLTFHRRDRPRSELPGASRAVLEHLALAGPLTIGEAAVHMRRAQSVISEIMTTVLTRMACSSRSRSASPGWPRGRRAAIRQLQSKTSNGKWSTTWPRCRHGATIPGSRHADIRASVMRAG